MIGTVLIDLAESCTSTTKGSIQKLLLCKGKYILLFLTIQLTGSYSTL